MKMNEVDKRMMVESRITTILTRHGGERIVGGPLMERLMREIVDDIMLMNEEGLLRNE